LQRNAGWGFCSWKKLMFLLLEQQNFSDAASKVTVATITMKMAVTTVSVVISNRYEKVLHRAGIFRMKYTIKRV
jgi:hypothetical protein